MNAPETAGSTKSLLSGRIRDKIHLKYYSIRTETAYVDREGQSVNVNWDYQVNPGIQ